MIPKFKAWLKEYKIMVKVMELEFDEQGELKAVSFHLDWKNPAHAKLPSWFDKDELDGVVLMQSTGLIDKNGVEMYEGDIVECQHTYNGIIKGKLVYCEAGACWGIEVFDEPTWYAWFCDDIEENENGEYDVKVIGNIYENPELLEEG